MSTKSERVWVIVHKKRLTCNTEARTRTLCISEFVDAIASVDRGRVSASSRGSWEDWKVLRAQGYRCVRATITYEVPDER